jgi:hypothetical protein
LPGGGKQVIFLEERNDAQNRGGGACRLLRFDGGRVRQFATCFCSSSESTADAEALSTYFSPKI